MKTKLSLLSLIAGAALLASCAGPATLGYLRDMEYETVYPAKPAPELKLQEDDNISIHVYSTVDAELAAPFNMGLGVSGGGTAAATTYTVERDGTIDFPVLGDIYVKGLTIKEVKEKIAGLINNSGYMKDPVVKIDFNNFKLTVLGEWGKSVMEVPEAKINLLQVVARSGGTSPSSKIDDVMVIRTVNDERIAYSVNLQSKDLFDSPVFYLQQNDIIYMKPKGLQMSTTGSTIVGALQTVFSFITSIAYASWWLNR